MIDIIARCGPIWAIDIDHLRAFRDSLTSVGALMSAGAAVPQALTVANTEEEEQDPYEGLIDEQGVMTLPIHGVMLTSVPGWLKEWGLNICDMAECRAWVQRATADDRVTAIRLDINSPGGTVAGADELAQALVAFSAEKSLTATATGLCASAAYWVASTAKRITATRLTVVGSIGIYAVLYDITAADKQYGIERVLVASGPAKGLGADGKVTPALVKAVKARIDAMAAIFSEQVGTSRKLKGKALAAVTTGDDWLAGEAKRLGLIDALTTDVEETDDEDEEAADGENDTEESDDEETTDDDKTDDDEGDDEEAQQAVPAVAQISATVAIALVASHPDAGAFITERIQAGDDEPTLRAALQARQADAVAAENTALRERLKSLETEKQATQTKLTKLEALKQDKDPGSPATPANASRKTTAEVEAMTPYQRASFFAAGGVIADDTAPTPAA